MSLQPSSRAEPCLVSLALVTLNRPDVKPGRSYHVSNNQACRPLAVQP